MLSEATRAKILEAVASFPGRRTGLLPALKLAQAEVGYLPPEAIAEVAELVGVSHAAAHELVTFYSMLHTEPVGQQVVEVCVQLPCAVKGADRLLRRLAEGLGVAPGETTPDGLVTLFRTHECYGACHRAPMCRVNEEYVENLGDEEAVSALVQWLRRGEVGPTADGRPRTADDREGATRRRDDAANEANTRAPGAQRSTVGSPLSGGRPSAVGGPDAEVQP